MILCDFKTLVETLQCKVLYTKIYSNQQRPEIYLQLISADILPR